MAEVSPAVATSASLLNMANRVTSLPSEIMFQVEMLPETLFLPSSKMSARLAGGLLHFVHLCVCISRIRKVPESATGWEEMYMETEELSWFDWVCPTVHRFPLQEISDNFHLYSDIPDPDLLDQHCGLQFHIPLLSHTYLRSQSSTI